MNYEQLWQDFLTLPKVKQLEVQALIAQWIKNQDEAKNEKVVPNIIDESLPFVGMWQDRVEMKDSREWVRSVRNRHWEIRK